jgi:hypothetical protein
MNERIKQLALEAIAYADSKVPANDRYNDIYHSIVRGKFAELIVRECLDIVGDYYGQSKKSGPGYTMICEIREHFGVEE